MPKPSLRSRKKWRLLRPLGGRNEIYYRKDKRKPARCGRCGLQLHGVPCKVPSRINKLPANQRRVDRIWGSQLCHNCLQDLLKSAIRSG